jgi:hypothetical protein
VKGEKIEILPNPRADAKIMFQSMLTSRLRRTALVMTVLISLAGNCYGQWAPDRENREYGIGIATVTVASGFPLYFHERSSSTSAKVAYFNDDTLIFLKSKKSVRSYDQMVETSEEEIGFPVLKYSADSQWVKVTLNANLKKNPPTAWIARNTEGLQVRSWTETFWRTGTFFFIRGEWRAFYSNPSMDSRIHPKLYERHSIANYCMRRKTIKGRWMQVELETPSSFCSSNEEVFKEFGVIPQKRLVWIQFLDQDYRPRIFYYTRGC